MPGDARVGTVVVEKLKRVTMKNEKREEGEEVAKYGMAVGKVPSK